MTIGRALLIAASTWVTFSVSNGAWPSPPIRTSKPQRQAVLPLQQTALNQDRSRLVFEPNVGQADPQVRFLTRARALTALFTGRENVMVLTRTHQKSSALTPGMVPETELTVVRMQLEGAQETASFEGLEKANSISNYFIGNDPQKWRTHVPITARCAPEKFTKASIFCITATGGNWSTTLWCGPAPSRSRLWVLPRKSSLLWPIRGFYRHLETKTLQSANERPFELLGVPAIEVI